MTEFNVNKNGQMDGYFTTAEFAKWCGVGIGTVRQWILRGKIRVVKVGRQNFIDKRTPYPKRKKYGKPAEAWKPPIIVDTTIKYFYRIGITRKDIHDCPVFEIAGFRDKNIAMNYANNIVKKRKDWDERTMQVVIAAVALPPMSVSNDTLAVKIEMLSKLKKEEGATND